VPVVAADSLFRRLDNRRFAKMESVWLHRIGNIVFMVGFDKRNTRNRWGAGISYSRPIWAPFSATERFISSTVSSVSHLE
jgi:hypothetical protein